MSNAESQLESVGLLLTTQHPEFGLSGILSIRGPFNPETALIPQKYGRESYPGLHQVTVHGKIKENERAEEALVREIKEELGVYWERIFIRHIYGNRGFIFHVSGNIATGIREVSYHDCTELPHPHFTFVNKDMVPSIRSAKEFDKKIGVLDRSVIAMFPDEIAVVKIALGL